LKRSVKILETGCKVRMARRVHPAFALSSTLRAQTEGKAQAWRERTCPEGLPWRIHRERVRPCWYWDSNLEQRCSTWG